MPWPTFLVLGAARAGTTALSAALRQHPQIGMSQRKEPNFFAYGELASLPFQGPAAAMMKARIVPTVTAYQALFSATTGQIALGEASMTIFLPRACPRIHHYVPGAKLIAILRHPADRAYSQFVHARQMGWEPLADFGAALGAEPSRWQQQWIPYLCYKYRGYYAARLAAYCAVFPREQMRIYRYETWQSTPQMVLQDIFQFLGVDSAFRPLVNPRLNVGQLSHNRWLQKVWRRLGSRTKHLLPATWQRAVTQAIAHYTLAPPPALAPALRQKLTTEYCADLLQLQTMLAQDFSDWIGQDKTDGRA